MQSKSSPGIDFVDLPRPEIKHWIPLIQQECIPVGCLPSTAVASKGGVSQHAVGRGCVSQHALGRWLSAWGMFAREGVCPGGVCPRGCLSGGVCLGVSTQGLSAWGCLPRGVCLPHPLWTEWQTPVKTFPCRNYVADGKKGSMVM